MKANYRNVKIYICVYGLKLKSVFSGHQFTALDYRTNRPSKTVVDSLNTTERSAKTIFEHLEVDNPVS